MTANESGNLSMDKNEIIKVCEEYTYPGTNMNPSGRPETEKVTGYLNPILWSKKISRSGLLVKSCWKSQAEKNSQWTDQANYGSTVHNNGRNRTQTANVVWACRENGRRKTPQTNSQLGLNWVEKDYDLSNLLTFCIIKTDIQIYSFLSGNLITSIISL